MLDPNTRKLPLAAAFPGSPRAPFSYCKRWKAGRGLGTRVGSPHSVFLLWATPDYMDTPSDSFFFFQGLWGEISPLGFKFPSQTITNFVVSFLSPQNQILHALYF